MTDIEKAIAKARKFDAFEVADLVDMQLVWDVVDAAYFGAFHHNSCPWLRGAECLCAKGRVDAALDALARAVLGGE